MTELESVKMAIIALLKREETRAEIVTPWSLDEKLHKNGYILGLRTAGKLIEGLQDWSEKKGDQAIPPSG